MKRFTMTGQLSRRRYLQMAATTAGATAIGHTLGWTEERLPGYIDAHVHVWTPDTDAYPLGEDYDRSAMQPASFTAEELFDHCRPAGVERVVLIQMSFYQFDNRYMLDTIAEYPQTFRGVAIIDHREPDSGATMRSLRERGISGFRLYATAKAAAAWLESPEMASMWKAAAETGQAICLLADPEALPSIEPLCRKFSQTRVVIDHFARIGMKGMVNSQDLDNLCRLAKYPQVFVKTSAFYALGAKQAPYLDLAPMIRRLRDTFGAQRLMWASDSPFQVEGGHSYAASLALVRNRLEFLTDRDKTWMLRKTAESVYWI